MTFEVQKQALLDDSKIWDKVAEATNAAANATQNLDLSEEDFGIYGGDSGLHGTYSDAVSKVATLLKEATSNCQGVSNALQTALYIYEAGDEYAARRLAGAWEPVV
jgi:hypothetical protein